MERARQAIVAAGMELFAERDFDAVTVADIAGAGRRRSAPFHRYFPDKAEFAASPATPTSASPGDRAAAGTAVTA